MNKNWIAMIVVVFFVAALLGFRTSFTTGIQPGYFEKQEAPAYGVAEEAAIGADFGKEFEEHYKDLYKDE
ncbi:MAG: hypothetical protein C4538_06480 [Nitrospiraceae bacterium]|nr:MAG: hypothetical protein C4538_06480 [Nitrospiraceae bacterium]